MTGPSVGQRAAAGASRPSARLLLGVALLVLLAACGGSPKPEPTPTTAPSPSSSGSPTTSPTTSPTGTPTTPAAACSGVRYADVLGTAPSYGPGRLRRYPVDAFACAAYWLPASDDLFVPQSLAVDPSSRTAYVGGYRWAPTFPPRPCQIAAVDLTTGQVRAFQPRFQASIYHPAPTYCRHGGGMQLTGDGLWVQETQRLWLLDPTKLGQGAEAPVKRWWRMGAGLRGSSMVVRSTPTGDRLGVASFSPRYRGRIYWFALSDLMRSGVSDLSLTTTSATTVEPVARGRVPRLLQGIAVGPGGLWYSTSGSGCAQLIGPDARRYDFVPGSEGLQFVGDRLYVTSESGARPYIRGTTKKNLPVLVGLDTAKVLTTPPSCHQ